MSSCGDCSFCCVGLDIVDEPYVEEFGFKPAGTPCSKLVDGKCGVYSSRPSVCRNFNCGFIEVGADPSWRPTSSGIFFSHQKISAIDGKGILVKELRDGAYGSPKGKEIFAYLRKAAVDQNSVIVMYRFNDNNPALSGPRDRVATAATAMKIAEARALHHKKV